MRAGRLLRQQQQPDKPCPACGHSLGKHFELPYGTPGYAPLVFHCRIEGCACARDFVEKQP